MQLAMLKHTLFVEFITCYLPFYTNVLNINVQSAMRLNFLNMMKKCAVSIHEVR